MQFIPHTICHKNRKTLQGLHAILNDMEEFKIKANVSEPIKLQRQLF